MKKLVISIFLFFIFSLCSYAQFDREFWFAVPEITSLHADRPIKLNMSAGNLDVYIQVSIPTNPDIEPKEIFLSANENITIDLTDWIDELENSVFNSPQNKGLFIKSDYPITVYYEVLGTKNQNVNNTEIFALKGSNALGTTFYTPFQNLHGNYGQSDAWSSIDVVATEDSTEIVFELTNPALDELSKNITITLNKGQTYSLRCNSSLGIFRFSGSKITSNKPIAVTIKDDSIYQNGFNSRDLVGDQIIPIDYIGIEYILFKGESFILATEDSTDIFVENVLTATINEGETFFLENTSTLLMESSKPVYVFQLTRTGWEYGGALIPHVSCTGSYNIDINRSTDEIFIIKILVKNGGQNGFSFNGNSNFLNSNNFNIINGTNNEWLEFERSFTTSEIGVGDPIKIENNSKPFHLAIISGSSNTGSRYGYFSSFNSLDLGVNFDACDNSILQVSSGLDSYTWSTGETSNSITVDSSGTYWIRGVEGTCETTDTIEVIIKPGISFELGNDTFVCGEPIILSGPENENYTYEWNTNDSIAQISVDSKGGYKLRITNQYGCFATDSVFVNEFTFTEANLNDTTICNDEITVVLQDMFSDFLWYNELDTLSKNNYVTLSSSGEYYLRRDNNCGTQYDTFSVEKREIILPNVFTPNNDGYNDELKLNLGTGEWEFMVYNRWGKPVFESKNFNGTLPNLELSDNTYYYKLVDKYCNEKSHNGWFTILK